MLIILGKSGTGKTTLCESLEKVSNLHKTVTYTTREKRPGEIEGKDYHFISTEAFKKMIQNNELMEYVCFHDVITSQGKQDLFYGSAKKDFLDPNQMIILNPEGLRSVLKNTTDSSKFCSILLDASESVLKARLKNRGDNPLEVDRRLHADALDFSGLKKEVDYVLNSNTEISQLRDQVLQILNQPQKK